LTVVWQGKGVVAFFTIYLKRMLFFALLSGRAVRAAYWFCRVLPGAGLLLAWPAQAQLPDRPL
jgi:hypothetical protein